MPGPNDLRTSLVAGVLLAALCVTPGFAQLPTSQSETLAPKPPPANPNGARAPIGAGPDPVIGSVDGKLIYLSDLTRVTSTLPEQMRNLPFDARGLGVCGPVHDQPLFGYPTMVEDDGRACRAAERKATSSFAAKTHAMRCGQTPRGPS